MDKTETLKKLTEELSSLLHHRQDLVKEKENLNSKLHILDGRIKAAEDSLIREAVTLSKDSSQSTTPTHNRHTAIESSILSGIRAAVQLKEGTNTPDGLACTIGQIAKRTGRSKAQISTVLRDLVDKGVVKKYNIGDSSRPTSHTNPLYGWVIIG